MKSTKPLKFLLFIIPVLLTGCDFVQSTYIQNKVAKEYCHSAMNGDYNKCLSFTSYDSTKPNVNKDTLVAFLKTFMRV